MIVPIPSGVKYTATLEGTAVKQETCAHCQEPYVYLLRRRAQGRGRSEFYIDMAGAAARAQNRAADRLRHALDSERDVVPCPQCGRFTADMVGEIRHRQLIRTGATASVLLVALGVAWGGCTPPFGTWSSVWWGAPAMAGLIVLSVVSLLWVALRDINAGAAGRVGRRSPKAMLLSEFEALMAAAQQAAGEQGSAGA